MTHFDLLLIGTGSGNSIIDERFSHLSVAIAEAGKFGGTCLNVGCIPTKMFVVAADAARQPAQAERLGVSASTQSIDWPAIRDRIFARIDAIEASGRDYRTNSLPNVTVYTEDVRFSTPATNDGPFRLTTESGREVSADHVVIAAGGHSHIPLTEGIDEAAVGTGRIHTSDTIMRLAEFPESVTIIGGGFVALEMASIFSGLGAKVTQAVRSDDVLKAADADVRAALTKRAGENWDLLLGHQTESVEVSDTAATVHFGTKAGEPVVVSSDIVLIATGRHPNSLRVGASAAQIDLHTDGRIVVDEYQRVQAQGRSVPGLWALGDVSSPYQLKHVANHEARIVGANLLADVAGRPGSAAEDALTKVNHRAVPYAVFTEPQVASVGMTEAEARDSGRPLTVKLQRYGDVAYGWALEDTESFCKVIADASTRQILGAHIVGAEASMIIQPLVTAMSLGIPADVLAKQQYWIHPALPEVVENALLGLEWVD